MLDKNPTAAVGLLEKVISMYKNGYLAGTHDHWWLVPTRNYYKNIYLQSINTITSILDRNGEHQEIIDICEEAMKHEQFDESIHYSYIKARAAKGSMGQAKEHFRYMSDTFRREFGISPTKGFEKLYSKLFKPDNHGQDSVFSSNSLIENYSPDGPLVCSPSSFKLQFQIDIRRNERLGQIPFICLFTLVSKNKDAPPLKILDNTMDNLKNILLSSLRKGDLIAKWNKSQMLLSLSALDIKQAGKALNRIQQKWKKNDNGDFTLNIRVEGMQQKETVI